MLASLFVINKPLSSENGTWKVNQVRCGFIWQSVTSGVSDVYLSLIIFTSHPVTYCPCKMPKRPGPGFCTERKNQLFDPLYISQCIFNMMGWIKDHSICISHDDRHTNIPFLALKTLLMCFSVTGWTFPVHCSRRPDSQHVTALMEADYREASINLPLITTKREAALNSCEMAAAVRKWSPGKRPRTLVLLLPAAIVLIVNPA